MKEIVGYLPDETYRLILRSVPLACVEAAIVDEKRKEYLLGKRTRNPGKGMWGVIGGRVFRGESLEEALQRELEREAEIKKFNYQFVAHESLFAETSEVGEEYHVISHIYKITTDETPQITEENSEFKWFKRPESSWHHSATRIISQLQKHLTW